MSPKTLNRDAITAFAEHVIGSDPRARSQFESFCQARGHSPDGVGRTRATFLYDTTYAVVGALGAVTLPQTRLYSHALGAPDANVPGGQVTKNVTNMKTGGRMDQSQQLTALFHGFQVFPALLAGDGLSVQDIAQLCADLTKSIAATLDLGMQNSEVWGPIMAHLGPTYGVSIAMADATAGLVDTDGEAGIGPANAKGWQPLRPGLELRAGQSIGVDLEVLAAQVRAQAQLIGTKVGIRHYFVGMSLTGVQP